MALERNGFSTGLYIVTLALASCANALDTGCNFRPVQKVVFDVLKENVRLYRHLHAVNVVSELWKLLPLQHLFFVTKHCVQSSDM